LTVELKLSFADKKLLRLHFAKKKKINFKTATPTNGKLTILKHFAGRNFRGND